jgi:signal transduction histidine kinase
MSPARHGNPSAAGILIVTAIEGIENTAAALAEHFGVSVEIASTRATALRLLARRCYSTVVLDQMLADSDPEGAEVIWKSTGLAIPLQFSFALAGRERLERELHAALLRRQREQQLAQSAAAAAIDAELKNMVTGLLLESQLALGEADLSPRLEARLRTLAEMAGSLRERLCPKPQNAPTVGLQ